MAERLAAQSTEDGVRTLRYGDGSVMPTMAVTAHGVDDGATLRLQQRTAGAVVLIALGSFSAADDELDTYDVVGLRSWTSYSLTAKGDDAVVLVIDTSPALRALGLYREEGA
jgi:gentisate 1,2-dioxygenase